MIDPKTDIKRLKESKYFKEWKQDHKDSFISNFFCIIDEDSSDDNIWQVDYYNPGDDTMTSFELPADKRKTCKLKSANSKIFKKEGETVEKLTISSVEWNDKNIIHQALEKLKEEHPSEQATKKILILQQNKETDKPVWNLTIITTALNLFNIRLNAINGKVINHSLRSALSLKKEMLSGTDEDKKPTAS